MNPRIVSLGLRAAAVLAALFADFVAAPALAGQVTITPPPSTPSLGKVVVLGGVSTFSIATDGTVTRTSGTAVRLTGGPAVSPTITMRCGLLNLENLCALRNVRVTVQAVSGSGPAKVTQLRMADLNGATMYGPAPTPGPTLTFTTYPMGLLTVITFKLGMDVEVSGTGVTGPQTFDYRVTAEFVQ